MAKLILTPNNSRQEIKNVEEIQATDVYKSPEELKSICMKEIMNYIVENVFTETK